MDITFVSTISKGEILVITIEVIMLLFILYFVGKD